MPPKSTRYNDENVLKNINEICINASNTLEKALKLKGLPKQLKGLPKQLRSAFIEYLDSLNPAEYPQFYRERDKIKDSDPRILVYLQWMGRLAKLNFTIDTKHLTLTSELTVKSKAWSTFILEAKKIFNTATIYKDGLNSAMTVEGSLVLTKDSDERVTESKKTNSPATESYSLKINTHKQVIFFNPKALCTFYQMPTYLKLTQQTQLEKAAPSLLAIEWHKSTDNSKPTTAFIKEEFSHWQAPLEKAAPSLLAIEWHKSTDNSKPTTAFIKEEFSHWQAPLEKAAPSLLAIEWHKSTYNSKPTTAFIKEEFSHWQAPLKKAAPSLLAMEWHKSTDNSKPTTAFIKEEFSHWQAPLKKAAPSLLAIEWHKSTDNSKPTTAFIKEEFSHWQNPKEIQKLINSLEAMYLYGNKLKQYAPEKSQHAILLAKDLFKDLHNFYNSSESMQVNSKQQFVSDFKNKLHSKDKLFSVHREEWKILIANILVALTGVGLLVIGASILSTGHGLFSKTRGQRRIDAVDQQFNSCIPTIKSNF